MVKGFDHFKLDRRGVRQLLRSPEIQDNVNEFAKIIRSRLGEGYAIDERVGKNRVNASVWPQTHEAYTDNLEHNSLLKAAFR